MKTTEGIIATRSSTPITVVWATRCRARPQAPKSQHSMGLCQRNFAHNPIRGHRAPPMLDIRRTGSTLGGVFDGSSSESADRHDHGPTWWLCLLGSAPLTQIWPSRARRGTPRRVARVHQTPKRIRWRICWKSQESGPARIYVSGSEHVG